jgi:hypothetical protein
MINNKYVSFIFRAFTALNIADKKNIVPIMTRVGTIGTIIFIDDNIENDYIIAPFTVGYLSPVMLYINMFSMIDDIL